MTAPAVSWNVESQKAAFPGGCEADYPGGYLASVPASSLDLKERVLSAPGLSMFLQKSMNKILGPILILAGMAALLLMIGVALRRSRPTKEPVRG